jgi:drug/metabolite transporter (DMT)-like permease
MAVAARATEDRPQAGIMMMLAAWFLFSLVDTSARWLALAGVPAMMLTFFRYGGHFAISIGVIARGGFTADRFHTSHFWQVAVRAAILISATLSNFYALHFLPLSITSAIMFSAPVLLCFLSWPLLGERVGPWRMLAILLGFTGVLIVIRPFGVGFHPAMLLCLYNALAMALYSIMTRKLAGVVATETQQFYMGLLGTTVMLPFAVWSWQMPESALHWGLLLGLGTFGWAGHQLLTNAHRFASASVLTPYTYSFMIYVAVLGYVIFGALPDRWTVIGALFIVTAGIIIWKREQR